MRDDDNAIVLLSGGLDSATCLANAVAQGYRCYALNVAYGQRHGAELKAAERLAERLGAVEFKRVSIDLGGIGGSALTDAAIEVPENGGEGIPVTYVPARNTVLLSVALAWAEVLSARDIFIGVNVVDYSGYPDCRPAFIQAFEELTRLATKAGAEEGASFRIHAPLIERSKGEIIRLGLDLGLDYAETVSCYRADDAGRACGACDACRLRRNGFLEAGVSDPTRYR